MAEHALYSLLIWLLGKDEATGVLAACLAAMKLMKFVLLGGLLLATLALGVHTQWHLLLDIDGEPAPAVSDRTRRAMRVHARDRSSSARPLFAPLAVPVVLARLAWPAATWR